LGDRDEHAGQRKLSEPGTPLERALHFVEVVERLEGGAFGAEVLRKPVAGEDSGGCLRDAPVREAVSDVDEATEVCDGGALARLRAHGAGNLVPEQDSPTVRTGVEPIREDGEPKARPVQHRLYQL